MQTVSGGILLLSFSSALTGTYRYPENGDNAKTTVQIYAEDGTLEYQSPLTRFFVGEQYTYTRPRTFADELVKTRSGALYWTNPIYVDESCSGVTCTPTQWTWRAADVQGAQTPSVTRGSLVHVTPFDYGYREHYWLNSNQWNAIPSYFIVYVLIPSNKAPDTILFGVNGGAMVQGHCAYWGATPSSSACWGWTGSVYLGPVPAIRDQWVMLVVKSTDIGLDGTWDGVVYGAAGGEVEWDVTTTQTVASWTDAYLKVSGLPPGVTVGAYYANNATQIGTGAESGGTANVLLYQRSQGI